MPPAILPRIALTSGEPAGVGPELCLEIARRELPCELVCLADRDLLADRARQVAANAHLTVRSQADTAGTDPSGGAPRNSPITLAPYDPRLASKDPGTRRPHQPGTLLVEHIPLAKPSVAGQLEVANARYVLNLLDRAIDGALAGEFDAIVTAPVHKGVINDAGVSFTGHTEYLAERTRTPRPVMMLATGTLRVALATTHLPLKAVSDAITIDSLCEVLEILDHDLRTWWKIERPRIGVCGLNPHAGEGGHLGDEEIRVIKPALDRMRERGLQVNGPLPADTAFVPRILADYDAMLAMYHDQGLPVIKHAGFDTAVNITLGLPLLRTSVDHGTALDLAGTGRADPSSLAAAIELAVSLATHVASGHRGTQQAPNATASGAECASNVASRAPR